MDSLQAALVDKLQKKDLGLAVAEAGTNGIVTRVLGETPGGQDILRYAVSVDTPEAKAEKLGIKPKLLKKHGGNVSEYAAISAAAAVQKKADIGVAVLADSGNEKTRGSSPGLVYIAVCVADTVYVKKLVINGGDADITVDAALSRALNMTRLAADYFPAPYTAAVDLQEALENHSLTEDVEETGGDEDDDDKSFFQRFIDNFVIRKTDSRGVKVRKFIFILALLIFLGSAAYVGNYYYGSYAARKQAEQLQNMFEFGDMENVEVSPDFPGNYNLKFAGLWNINRDVIAFLSIPDTQVRYPIVQADDNNYYLRRDFYANNNQHGIPFMDYRVDVKKPSDNMVIYGHNMKDGQIFGELMSYKGLEYYQEHPVINCTTVYDEGVDYKIFSIFITNAYENQGPVFAYHDFIDASSKTDFMRFVAEVEKRSLIKTTVDVDEDDRLLTLSTCSYEFTDARLVVVARAVRRGESSDVDTGGAMMNPSPLMPDIWYKAFGGSKPIGESTPEITTQPTTNSNSSSSSRSSSVSSVSSSRSGSSQNSGSNDAAASRAASRAASDAEASRLASEAEASRLASEKAASDAAASKAASDAEASRLASEAEASRIASEAEASRLASEAEASRLASEAEAARLASEAEAARLASEAEAALKIQPLSATSSGDITVSVSVDGRSRKNADALDIISRLVQNEIGSAFQTEALKAQAVAAYTYIAQANASGSVPAVNLASKADKKVINAVSEVLGEAVYYKNKLAFTPYHSTSAGSTTSSESVWGGSYPYLVSVDSSVDEKASNFKVKTTMTLDDVEDRIYSNLGITPDGDPADWFEVLTYTDGDYNGDMAVCGKTKTRSGTKITGRLIRETVLNLRSACFVVDYNSKTDKFTFTTYGYGHGVGMSQNGANLYAKQGWDYIEILEHYYPGTRVK